MISSPELEAGRAPAYYPPAYSFAEEELGDAKVPLSQYLWILKRHRWRICGFIAAAVIATLIVSARLTPIYESTVTVDIDRQTPPGVVGQDATRSALNDADQFLATQIKLVQSDSVLRPVDRRFHLREREPQGDGAISPREAEAPVTFNRLKVTRPPNTYLLLIGYRSADPQLAADVANAIAQSYLEHTYNIRIRSSASLSTFMEKQLEELKAKMERSSLALAGFERELNVINPEEKTNILASRLLQLNAEYAATPTSKLDELTSILVENQSGVKDQTGSQDVSPLESQRLWEHQAEENILTRLEKGGLLAPPGSVDEVLNTVVSNLIVSSGLNVEARCRVLLTTPMETFPIGRTVVISRGLIDVLPDETSLALVLAGELSHIALGHRAQTQFAFYNQTMLSDAELLQRFRFERSPQEMLADKKKTVELMRASPYQKVANAGLFLKALASRGSALPRLLQANLGNHVANAEALGRLSEFSAVAPVLEEDRLDQIAALPLGSRVKLDPWTNRISLVKTRPISLLSAREKMPFEVTPFVLYLTRVD
jgi:capsular polysaccharide biosynthesis protein